MRLQEPIAAPAVRLTRRAARESAGTPGGAAEGSVRGAPALSLPGFASMALRGQLPLTIL